MIAVNEGLYELIKPKLKKRRVSLLGFAKRLGVREYEIRKLLFQAGFIVSYKASNVVLNEKHLDVLLHAYIRGLKTLFARVHDKIEESTAKNSAEYFHFFSRFVDCPQSYDQQTIYGAELDDKLIEDFFYFVASHSGGTSTLTPTVIRIRLDAKTKVGSLRSRVHPIFNSFQFFNFQSDEEDERSKFTLDFS